MPSLESMDKRKTLGNPLLLTLFLVVLHLYISASTLLFAFSFFNISGFHHFSYFSYFQCQCACLECNAVRYAHAIYELLWHTSDVESDVVFHVFFIFYLFYFYLSFVLVCMSIAPRVLFYKLLSVFEGIAWLSQHE